MPTGWLEEEFDSSPPYSPRYNLCQPVQEAQPRGDGVVNEMDLRAMPAVNQWPSEIESSPNFRYPSGAACGPFGSTARPTEDDLAAFRTQVRSPQSSTKVKGTGTMDPALPGLSTLPIGGGLGTGTEAKSDLDSLFGDSEIASDLVENSNLSQSREKYDDGAGFKASEIPEAQHATSHTYAQEIERLARRRFEQDLADRNDLPFKRETPQVYANPQSEEYSHSGNEDLQDSKRIHKLEDAAYRDTGPANQLDLPEVQDLHLHREVREMFDIHEPDIPTRVIHDERQHGGYHGKLECTCPPLECLCAGCDHSEQIDEMMQAYWQKDIEVSGCNCVGGENRCSCLPGLGRCDNCHEHSQTKSPVSRLPTASNGSFNIWPTPPSPPRWRDVFPHGQKILDDTGNWIIKSKSPPIPWTVVKRYEVDDLPVRPNPSREERDGALQDLYESTHGQELHQSQGISISKGATELTGDVQERKVSHCSCFAAGNCTRASNTGSCAGGLPIVPYVEALGQVAHISRSPSCSCAHTGNCTCSPGSCRCGPSSHLPPVSDPLQSESTLVSEEIANAPRSYLSVSDLAGVLAAEYRSQAATPKPYSYIQSQMPLSRPDTPRPHLDTTPSTPYASEIRPEYFERMLDADSIRQSVEPEVPLANWQRESTPAYEDRSLTPSPISRGGDVAMLDGPSDRGSVPPMLPPMSPVDSKLCRSTLASRPPIPPIPSASSGPLKIAKRDERRKSGVQGSKVDKRSATGSPTKAHARSKSRNITKKLNVIRQPPLPVGDMATREDSTVEPSGNPPCTMTPTVAAGRVAVAVANIEAQVNRQQEEKDMKQKDGTPVRRSQRKNKGVRTSLGLEN